LVLDPAGLKPKALCTAVQHFSLSHFIDYGKNDHTVLTNICWWKCVELCGTLQHQLE